MKRFVYLIFIVASCTISAADRSIDSESNASTLSGKALFRTLLKNSNHSLQDELLCQPPITAEDPKSYTLGDQLSLLLAMGHYDETSAKLDSTCSIDIFETPSGETVDVWDCQITVVETNTESEFVSSSILAVAISRPQKIMVPGSLRCL
ncbi:hypothetical protein [Nitrincola sp.]|uniref:hypothetical protein n=1 Tax=Nitrincola sp. TaxID=1926584 RepID=UPI003A8DA409